MFLYKNHLCHWVKCTALRRRSQASHPLEDTRSPLAHAHAHRHQPKALVVAACLNGRYTPLMSAALFAEMG